MKKELDNILSLLKDRCKHLLCSCGELWCRSAFHVHLLSDFPVHIMLESSTSSHEVATCLKTGATRVYSQATASRCVRGSLCRATMCFPKC